jgi:hypothetical protein
MAYSNDYIKNTLRLYDNRHKFKLPITEILKLQLISRYSLYNWVKNRNTIKDKNIRKKRKK